MMLEAWRYLVHTVVRFDCVRFLNFDLILRGGETALKIMPLIVSVIGECRQRIIISVRLLATNRWFGETYVVRVRP